MKFKIVFIMLFTLLFAMRIISTAPSITETLFAIGAGKEVVGVTSYCDYPAQAKFITAVGGYYDFDGEKILELQPDILLLMKGNFDLKWFCEQHKIKYYEFESKSIEDILAMMLLLGKLTSKEKEAFSLVEKIKIGLEEKRKNKIDTKNVLYIVGQDIGNNGLEACFIVGNEGFYNSLFSRIGLRNAYKGKLQYPKIDKEGLLAFNPDLIIVFEEGKIADYYNLPLKAVKEGQIYFLPDFVYKRPGPRMLEIIEGVNNIIN